MTSNTTSFPFGHSIVYLTLICSIIYHMLWERFTTTFICVTTIYPPWNVVKLDIKMEVFVRKFKKTKSRILSNISQQSWLINRNKPTSSKLMVMKIIVRTWYSYINNVNSRLFWNINWLFSWAYGYWAKNREKKLMLYAKWTWKRLNVKLSCLLYQVTHLTV